MKQPILIATTITIFVAGILYLVWNPQQQTTDTSVDNTPVENTPQETEQPLPPPPPVSGNITVASPAPGDTVSTTLSVTGTARVFEQTVNYRLTDANNVVLVQGITTAQAVDIGLFGPYTISTTYATPTASTGILEVFAISAENGSEIDTVTIPVTF